MVFWCPRDLANFTNYTFLPLISLFPSFARAVICVSKFLSAANDMRGQIAGFLLVLSIFEVNADEEWPPEYWPPKEWPPKDAPGKPPFSRNTTISFDFGWHGCPKVTIEPPLRASKRKSRLNSRIINGTTAVANEFKLPFTAKLIFSSLPAHRKISDRVSGSRFFNVLSLFFSFPTAVSRVTRVGMVWIFPQWTFFYFWSVNFCEFFYAVMACSYFYAAPFCIGRHTSPIQPYVNTSLGV